METTKKYAAVTTITGAGVSASLEYLDIFNSLAGSVAIIVTIVGGYWLYRRNKAEALKADAETERIKLENEAIRLDNHAEQVRLEAVAIEQRLEKTAVILIEKLHVILEKKI